MKALVMKQLHQLEIQDVPEPEVAPDQIKAKIAYCGICGSDIEQLEGRFVPPSRAGGASASPRIMGHKASGTIVEVGKEVRGNFKVGRESP